MNYLLLVDLLLQLLLLELLLLLNDLSRGQNLLLDSLGLDWSWRNKLDGVWLVDGRSESRNSLHWLDGVDDWNSLLEGGGRSSSLSLLDGRDDGVDTLP